MQYGFVLFLQGLGDAVVFVRPVSRFADVQDEVNVVHALPGGAVHVAVDGFVAVLVDTGGIDEDKLVIAAAVDAEQGMPRGLRLAAGDGDFLAEEVVDEGGFADVGAADDGDVSGALGHVLFLYWASSSAAACCSAFLRLLPCASAMYSPLVARIWNSRACSGPLSLMIW